jgi:hypothetical protein
MKVESSLRKEKEQKMKMRRPLFNPAVLLLVVGIPASVMLGGDTVLAAPVQSTIVIPIAGTVGGPPESVSISGNVQIKSTLVLDPDFNRPAAVLLSIDFLPNVTGRGLSTGTSYVAPAEQELVRPLADALVIQMTFPFFPDTPGGFLSARSGLVAFTLSYDDLGRVKAGTATVSTPNF